MDVIRYSVQVLLNVSKYERTTQAVYEVDNSIDTLLDLLQTYRGKAGDNFGKRRKYFHEDLLFVGHSFKGLKESFGNPKHAQSR